MESSKEIYANESTEDSSGHTEASGENKSTNSSQPVVPQDVQLPQETQANAGSSWYSWFQTAKEKTMSTFELVKNDLSEFGDAVSQEANVLMTATTSTIKEKAPQLNRVVDVSSGLVKGLVDTVNSVLQIEDTTKDEDVIPLMPNRSGSTHEARLFFIQNDPGTYCNEPEGAPELFDDWLDQFSLEEHGEDIASLLANNPEVRIIFARLVPSKISTAIFWQRYFYKLHQFKLDEARRLELIKRSSDADYTPQPWEDDLLPDEAEIVNKEDCALATSSPLKEAASTKSAAIDEPLHDATSDASSDFQDCLHAELQEVEFGNVGELRTQSGSAAKPHKTAVVSSSSSPTDKEAEDAAVISLGLSDTLSEVESNNGETSSKLSDGWASGISTPAEPADAPSLISTPPGKTTGQGGKSSNPDASTDGDDWVEWDH